MLGDLDDLIDVFRLIDPTAQHDAVLNLQCLHRCSREAVVDDRLQVPGVSFHEDLDGVRLARFVGDRERRDPLSFRQHADLIRRQRRDGEDRGVEPVDTPDTALQFDRAGKLLDDFDARMALRQTQDARATLPLGRRPRGRGRSV